MKSGSLYKTCRKLDRVDISILKLFLLRINMSICPKNRIIFLHSLSASYNILQGIDQLSFGITLQKAPYSNISRPDNDINKYIRFL